MANERPRAPRRTIGEFGRDIDELRGSARHLGSSLPAFTKALSSFLDDAAVAMYLYDDADDEFVLRGSTQRLQVNGEALRFGAGGTLPGLALAEHRTVSLSEEPGLKGGRLRAEEHVFPLEAGGRALGAVTVTHVAAERLSPVRLDAARRGVLRFADSLGKARVEEAAARRINRLSAINEFGVILVSALVPEEVPALATAMTSFIMGTEGCILRLRDEKTAEPTVRDAHGLREEASSRRILELEKLASQEVLVDRKGPAGQGCRRQRGLPRLGRTRQDLPLRSTGGRGRDHHPVQQGPGEPADPRAFQPGRPGRPPPPGPLHREGPGECGALRREPEARGARRVDRAPRPGQFPGAAPHRDQPRPPLSPADRARDLRVAPAPAREENPAGQAAKQMVQRVAQAIRGAVRDYDTVARIAEHTFGIILPQVQNGTGSPIARIQAAIDREVDLLRRSGGAQDLPASFSHMTFPDDGVDGEQMLARLEKQG